MNKKIGKQENCILSLLIMGISAVLMSICFDFYFDLNDDTMMRDIMSGIYSGTPDGHNMQTLYPLGALIALCYRISGSFPWYGAFLFLCQFGCFFAVGVRFCALADASLTQGRVQTEDDSVEIATEGDGTGGAAGKRWRFAGKICCLLMLAFFQWGIWLTHMVNVQYTITCSMLVGTAVFLFLTNRGTSPAISAAIASETSSAKAFLIDNILPLLLFLLAFQLRSEMALLVLPFLGLAGAFCWWEERPVFTGKNLKKYGALFLLLLAGMGLSLGADALAYGGEWRTFRQFFDDRTSIYDFYREVVTDDIYGTDLESLSVSSAGRMLLRNYNFGLDEEIDAQLLSDIAVYAKDRVGGARDWSAIFRAKLLLYRYRSFHGEDAPYNLLVLLGYAANIISVVILSYRGVCESRGEGVFGKIFLIFLVRSALWMFILMCGRDPERITHSLYLVEFCLLAGLYLRRIGNIAETMRIADISTAVRWSLPKTARKFLCGAAAALFMLSAASMIKTVPAELVDQERRWEINADWEAIDAYCRARQDTFFFEDVYSTVAFSGKLLERREHTLANYDIVGGWICKSPLYHRKLAAFGIESASDALLAGRAYFIMSDEERELRGLDWLTEFYAEKGVDAEIAESDRINENYGVYRIHAASGNSGSAKYALRK